MNRRPQGSRHLVAIGAVVTALSVVVLIGWHLRIEAMLRLAPGLPVVRYNTALALTGLGSSLVALGVDRRFLATVLGLLAAQLGALTLLQYLTGASLGIDPFMVRDLMAELASESARTPYPGRMAPLTAVCVAMLGVAIPLGQGKRRSALAAMFLATASAGLAIASLIASTFGIDYTAEHWLSLGMATQTSAMLALCAVGLLHWMVSFEDRAYPHVLAAGSGIGTLALTLMVWQGISTSENEALRHLLSNQATSIREEILRTLGSNAYAVRRMAKRWEVRGGTPRAEWEADAHEYVAALPGVESLVWVDADDRLRWIVPNHDPMRMKSATAAVTDTVRRAREVGDVIYSDSFELVDGSPAFLIATPLRPGNRSAQGVLVAVCRTRALVETLLFRQLAAGVHVRLLQDGHEVYEDAAAASSREEAVVENIQLDGNRWQLELSPAPSLVAQSRTRMPEAALWGGTLLSLLLFFALDRGLVAGQHARHLVRQRTALRESEGKYRSLVDSMTEGIIVAQDERCVFANPALATMLGYQVDELVGLAFAEYIGPDHVKLATERYRARVAAADGDQAEPAKNYETQFRHKDGHLIWVNLHARLTEFDGRPAVQTVVHDIDARKQVEAALQFEQQRMELVARGAVDGIWDWNVITGEEYLSDRWYELLGYAPGELPATLETWSHMLHPDERNGVLNAIQRHLALHEPFDVECRMRTKSGEYRWYRSAGQATWDATGKPVRMAGSISDIHDRKRTEHALTLSESRFRAAMEYAPIGMALVSLEGKWLLTNESLCAIVGYTAAELARLTFQDITHPDDLGQDLAYVHDVIAGRIQHYSMEKRYIRKDGSIVWVLLSVSLARDADGAPEFFISQIENIDERKRQERQIRESLQEKEMLLREVYHRVKNNLQVIRSLLNLQSRTLPEGDARRAMQETAARVRAMALVHEKLYQSGNLASIAMQEFAGDLIAQIRESTGIDPNRVAIRAEIGKLEMGLDTAIPLGLLMNELVSNCVKHGFPDGRQGRITVQLLARDDGAELIVEDDGIGLPADFDPAQARSMGLRLATSLARQLGDTLEFESEPGRGSRFRVGIPSLTESVEAAAHRMSVADRSLHGVARRATR